MVNRIPKRLRQEPLIEAIWQVHFEPAHAQPLGDILPGILFAQLRPKYSDLQIHRLPVAEIPAPVAAADPNLRYAAKYRIEALGSSFMFHVGDRVTTINCRRPYVGWASFKNNILHLVGILEDSGLIPVPQQHSLRYIDLLTLDSPPGFGGLSVSLIIGDLSIDRHPVQLRVELPDDGCTHVLQLITPAQVRLGNEEALGTLIDLESVAASPLKDWAAVRDNLDSLHDASKGIFFSRLLTLDAVQRMDPEY